MFGEVAIIVSIVGLGLATVRCLVTMDTKHTYTALLAHGVALGTILLYVIFSHDQRWLSVIGLIDVSLMLVVVYIAILTQRTEKLRGRLFGGKLWSSGKLSSEQTLPESDLLTRR